MRQEEDFMIGDWVQSKTDQSIFQIKTHWNLYNAKDFDPVLITPEILEMNGFEQRKEEPDIYDCGGYVSYIMGLRGYRMGGEDTCVVAYNKKYVHELQHALRLCKIDKEIKL